MKKIITIIILAAFPVILNAQDFVDGLIDKYQGKQGFTTVVINKTLFDIAAAIDDDEDLQKMKGMIDNVRIIAMEDHFSSTDINFFDEMKSQIDTKSYVELMTVKEHDNDVVFYVKYASNKDIEELLLVVGGHDDNVVVSIKGKISLKPDDKFYDVWHQWLKDNNREKYDEVTTSKTGQPVTGIKQKIIQMIYKELDIKRAKYEHGFKRGCYFANIYQNGKEFLRSEIKEEDLVMRSMYQRDVEYIETWWKRKAVNRYTKLLEQNKIKPEKLFYSGMINISWEEAKEKAAATK